MPAIIPPSCNNPWVELKYKTMLKRIIYMYVYQLILKAQVILYTESCLFLYLMRPFV